MKMFSPSRLNLLAVLLLLYQLPAFAQPGEQAFIAEGYPDTIQARLEARQKLFASQSTMLSEKSTFTAQTVIDISREWVPGQTLRVAFSGGDAALRTKIEDAAQEWGKYCKIKFDFRNGSKYREWSPTDQNYAADIRISFNHPEGGYWSQVGRDSRNPSITLPNEASMNFQGFTTALPADYAGTVKHEFGHALGFQHEHQNPVDGCDHDFRWDDDAGYVPTRDQWGQMIHDSAGKRPGIYTVLGGPLNNWPKAKVDWNLRQLSNSSAFNASTFDVKSIMKYYFPDWMFVQGTASHCFGPHNFEISDQDKTGAATMYPNAPQDVKSIISKQMTALNAILKLKGLQPGVEKKYQALRDSLPR